MFNIPIRELNRHPQLREIGAVQVSLSGFFCWVGGKSGQGWACLGEWRVFVRFRNVCAANVDSSCHLCKEHVSKKRLMPFVLSLFYQKEPKNLRTCQKGITVVRVHSQQEPLAVFLTNFPRKGETSIASKRILNCILEKTYVGLQPQYLTTPYD